MAKTRPSYTPEFRRQMVELVRASRAPEELAQEFEPNRSRTGSVRLSAGSPSPASGGDSTENKH
jgi:transposase